LVQAEVARMIPQLTESVLKNVERSTASRIQEESKPSANPNEVVHNHVTCDGCGVSPIVGFRYKCIICHNFDFCDKCESEGKHPHAFIKIRHPSQVPRVLITSEEDIAPGFDINGQKFNVENLINNPGPAIDLANKFVPGLNLTEEKVKGFLGNLKDCKRERKERKHCHSNPLSHWFGLLQGLIPGFESNTGKTEEKVEEKTQEKSEVKVEASFDGHKTREERNTAYAAYLEEMFEKDLSLMLKFVEANPTLGKYELAERWIEENL